MLPKASAATQAKIIAFDRTVEPPFLSEEVSASAPRSRLIEYRDAGTAIHGLVWKEFFDLRQVVAVLPMGIRRRDQGGNAQRLGRAREPDDDLAGRTEEQRDLGMNDRVVDLVDEGWDAAVRIGRIHDGSLIARRLAPCRLLVAASPTYLAEHGTPRTIAELSSHNCLGYTFSSLIGPDRWSFGADGLIVAPVAGDFRANNGDVLLRAARAGRGIIYQPTFIIGDDLRAGSLVALQLDQPPIELDGVFAVYPGGRRPPAKVRALVDHLAATFSPEPYWDRDLGPVA